MRVIIIGGGIAATYLANNLKKQNNLTDVLILSDEPFRPYDRIHLCRLVDQTSSIDDISLDLDPTVKIELSQNIQEIDAQSKKVITNRSLYKYDKLIIATGSYPIIDAKFSQYKNCCVFRNSYDCEKIKKGLEAKNIVVVGSGPIALELLETLSSIDHIKNIILMVRSKHLYDRNLSLESIKTIEDTYLQNSKVTISYEDEIYNFETQGEEITKIYSKSHTLEDPFVIFGIGILPNIYMFQNYFDTDKGILTNRYMQTSVDDVYAVGECAQVKLDDDTFIAGHVKECTDQADVAIEHIYNNKSMIEFKIYTAVDMLKVGNFELLEARGYEYNKIDIKNIEKIVISNKQENRIDEYFLHEDRLVRFIGINSNVDIGYIETLINEKQNVDINYLYENRLLSEKGRLICSCEHVYKKDIQDIVQSSGCDSFFMFKEFSEAGRVCGRCKVMVEDAIKESQSLIDPNMPKRTAEDIQREKKLQVASQRIDKFNKLHPRNNITSDNLDAAMESVNIATKELNSWISMVTASMKLHPSFEPIIKKGVKQLNKIPVIWLELSDCSGNSEAFIKSTNPQIEDLIFDYISLDYHELIMSTSGDQSETVLEEIITEDKGKYILIVEGAIPLGLDGKFLRIGPKGETGLELLQKCAKDAALILAVGSCALDGGIVAAAPNPTNAVGVAQALNSDDIINLPGCPVNPINIVGTLLSYIMFDELPKLDKFNRPLWAYEGRIHDNCERRGHYELGEFVQQWGDEGAKKGYCLFQMGCKGPYANANCPTMKFNGATSWPVQVGHGCMGCTEVGFVDKFANERIYEG